MRRAEIREGEAVEEEGLLLGDVAHGVFDEAGDLAGDVLLRLLELALEVSIGEEMALGEEVAVGVDGAVDDLDGVAVAEALHD